MRIVISTKYFVFTTVALVAFAIGSYAWLGYSLRHLKVDVSGLGILFTRVADVAELTTPSVPNCRPTAEPLPNGDRKREATMLYVATVVDLYKSTFGKLPETIDDLDKLPSFRNTDNLNGLQVKKNCFIRPEPRGYVLACGTSLPPSKEVEFLLSRAGGSQSFHMLGSSEVLYTPKTPCQ